MAMSASRADTTLEAALTGTATPHILLHTGDPGADGSANVATQPDGTTDIVRKSIDFDAPANHATNDERVCYSSSPQTITWDDTEINDGQDITHFSIWDGDDASAPTVEFVAAVTDSPRTVGSDGVTITDDDVEVAIGVYAKPA